MTEKIRIKDIAERAGVSVGTVDRVLHDRPNVSRPARDKVEKALQEMDYQPNMYASALAYNRSYTFYLLIPRHESEAYWEEIEDGAHKAMEARRDFHIGVKIVYYDRFDFTSYAKSYTEILNANPDGVVIVPSTLEITQTFTDKLHEKSIPFILLDSYMPDLRPLSFYGQDSFSSGCFAAKMLMLFAAKEKEIMIFKRVHNGVVVSKQQANREVGFLHYMKDHFPKVKITELNVEESNRTEDYNTILDRFFTSHPNIHHCVTLSSKAHIIGEYLLKHNIRDVQTMGYDVVQKNAECIREGSISFVIAQHAYMQGYSCIDTMFQAIVLKKKVNPVNYMPIELIIKENLDFYRRNQL